MKNLNFAFDPEFPFREEPHNDIGQFIAIENDLGQKQLFYDPWPHQIAFHSFDAPNILALGTRGTGKSLMLRQDAIMRCMAIPHFHALIVRRTMPELRRSHLVDIEREMKLLGGVFLHGVNLAKFPNGSTIVFAHCETEADILNFLSSQYGAIYFDELSTFSLNQFLQISAAARAPENAGYTAIVRAGSNPLGSGAEWMEAWFVTKNVKLEDYPDYHPDDYVMQFSTLEDNPSIDRKAYTARLQNLPEHVRRAWLYGEFVVEGAYFKDFRQRKKDEPEVEWHVIENMPRWTDRHGNSLPLLHFEWLSIYRAIDWGYDPDPAVCLWIALLPNKKTYVIKEMKWEKTLAKDVAEQIRKASEGYHIVETFADPTMFIRNGTATVGPSGAPAFSIAEIFEQNGVPLTASINDRTQFGYSIHDHLNTLIDGTPQLQIVKYAAKDLIRTFPTIRTDKLDPVKMADGEDHWVVALAYYCMGLAAPARDPFKSDVPFWMRKKPKRRPVIHG